ncbi:MAG: T9SS type A sorting domain-containing protein, partial [bacterium]|nr:T9SS type A sorting domain-containing protein [bacterium]
VSPTITTSYTLTGTAANSCTDNAVISVSVNASPALTITPSSTVICSGKTVTLTGTGASTYSWTSGPINSIYNVSPTITTSYTLTGTAANTCTDNAVISVSVNAPPILTITPSSTLICSGKTVTLTGTGASTYSWTSGPFNSIYNVSPTITTSYTLTGTAANSCTDNAVISVSVNASPVLTVTPSSTVICSGNTLTLSGTGANSYTWTGYTASASIVASPTISTNYTLNATALNGCTNTAVQNVSVNALPALTITPSSTVICSGKTLTLSGSGANSYTWTGYTASASVVASPTTGTNYTLNASALNGCTNTAVQNVSVNALPSLSVAANTSVVCRGGSAQFTAAGATTYTWNTGLTTTTIAVSPTITTSYSVTGTLASTGCSNTAVQNLSVNALPVLSITASSSVICVGRTTTLTVTGAGTYSWSNGLTVSTITVSPSVNTSYTVNGTASTSGCSNTAVQSISVIALPVISISPSSTVICSGNTVTLTATGGNIYSWSTGSITPAIVVSPTTSTTFTTSYSVIGTSTVTGCNNTAVQVLSVRALPNLIASPTATAICLGKTVSLVASGANSYTWNTSATTAVIAVSPTTNTSYTVTGTFAATGCSTTAVANITVNPNPVLSVSGNTFICANSGATLNVSGASSYTWASTSGTLSNNSTLVVTPSVTTNYSVLGNNAFNCTSTAVFQVKATALITPSLCLVTVDSLSVNNEIYWDKALYPQADTFIVRRLTQKPSPNIFIYSVIARISKNGNSYYVDTSRKAGGSPSFDGNPNFNSYQYQLQYRDTCGNLSSLSKFHQSLFIQDAKNGNFSWNTYSVQGLPSPAATYYLCRRNVITGITTTVGSTPNLFATDPQYNALSLAGNVIWYVAADVWECATPTVSLNGRAAAKNGTKSNQTNERQFHVDGVTAISELGKDIQIYPNPVQDELTVDLGSLLFALQLEIRDVSGRLIARENFTGGRHIIDMKAITNGVYFLSVYQNTDLIRCQRIIVQHH